MSLAHPELEFDNVSIDYVNRIWFTTMVNYVMEQALIHVPLIKYLNLSVLLLALDVWKKLLQGLLRGGSNRRVTPLSDISSPLPENSFWKKITLHHGAAKEREYKQAWTTEDVPLCKLCQDPCK